MLPVTSTKQQECSEDQLLQLWRSLAIEQQQQLADFAAFLVEKYGKVTTDNNQPVWIDRPEQESVIAAIKRLSATFPMIDKAKILHQTSALMAEHLMQGKEASLVIDDLEALFRTYYTKQTGITLEQ